MIPREFLDEIRSLRNEVCGQYLPNESDDESTLQAIDDLEHPLDNEEEPDTFSTGAGLDNILTKRESTTPLSLVVLPGATWFDGGNKYREAVTIRHCTISFTMIEAPADGFFWVKVELSPVGQRHPQAWATQVQDQDSGARLAFRVYLTTLKPGQLSFE